MNLSDFILTTKQNQILTESAPDCRQHCLDRKHFDTYPYTIEYRYNSRGFRDNEWPDTIEELKNCIWCFGERCYWREVASVWPRCVGCLNCVVEVREVLEPLLGRRLSSTKRQPSAPALDLFFW